MNADSYIPQASAVLARLLELHEALRLEWVTVMVVDPDAPMEPWLRQARDAIKADAEWCTATATKLRCAIERARARQSFDEGLVDFIARTMPASRN